ncbi:DUF6988 family protein [Acinetobacter sp. ANC 3813]|uniref:DUF6988 family protein n=1 Tax=Acinetobacter sp. ANC 3813 TaxID=1977873 RepID=UPI000A333D15|nr:hypothetical protein [Acinetobacter sp. ANC 3813]OTG89403.1 hypothetical protein B9T34_12100 [Acinetobacter sp. ANC 3813]
MIDIFRNSEMMLSELNTELNHSIFMDGGLRLDLVYECCDLSIEHGQAILQLLETQHDISALALFRVQFEAVVRAYWLLNVATNAQVHEFEIRSEDELLKNVKTPTASGMISQLENVVEINHIVGQFKEFKFYSLQHLHSIVHTGRNSLIQRKAGVVNGVREVIVKQVNGFIVMAAQILLRHAGKEKYIHYIHQKFRQCFQMQSDISDEYKAAIDRRYKKAL